MPRPFRLPFRSRSQVAGEVDEELEFHIQMVASRLRTQGWSSSDALAEARRRFGDLDYTRTYCRAEDLRREGTNRRMNFFDELSQDLRQAFRTLRRAPGFAFTALATLALGIGANTAMFSVVRSVLLEPLPFAEPDRLVRLWHANPTNGTTAGPFSEPDFLDLRAASTTADVIGGYFHTEAGVGFDLTGDGDPERLTAALVTPGFFEALQPRTEVGRTLVADEHVEGKNRVVVISHSLWQRRFGSDRSVAGRIVQLNGEPFTIVGVMPARFVFPAVQAVDLWAPLSLFGPNSIGRSRGARFLSLVARLKPGATEAQFREESAGIAARLAQQYPDNPGWTGVTVRPLREAIVGEVSRPLFVLLAAVAAVLLITCANVAGLMLARASARQRELAVRAALGAGRGRIIRQLMTESLTIAVAGGVIGVVLAFVALRALVASGAAELPGGSTIHMDTAVLLFSVGVTLLSGVAFGALPALRAAGRSLETSLRAGTRGAVGARGQRVRAALVVAEVALAVVLVTGAGLASKSFARLTSVPAGYNADNALVVQLTIPPRHMGSGDATSQYYQRVLDAIRAVPGVRAAGSIRDLPTRGNGEPAPARAFGFQDADAGGEALIPIHHISGDFFRAMDTPLLGGRGFEPTDRAGAPRVIMINEEFVRRFWPGETGVGKVLRAGTTDYQVIGVVGNIRHRGPGESVEPVIYVHALQNMRIRMSIVVRTANNPSALGPAIRRAIWAVDDKQTITTMSTLAQFTGRAVARPALLAWLLSGFGIVGLALGAFGLYGLLSFAIAQRRQEIGVRMALGASPRAVTSMVVTRALALAGGGVLIGVAAARLLAPQMQTVLYDIAPTDMTTFAEVIAVLLAAALLAAWIPARRARRIDPIAALSE